MAARYRLPSGAFTSLDAGLEQAVANGQMQEAAFLLGRPFRIRGEVVHGKKLGRTIGFPTANIMLGDSLVPRFGVYATRTRLPDGRKLPGVANVGINPTVEICTPRLEVWLIDFDEDLYGKTLDTELLQFIRPEAKFESLKAMVAQIELDVETAKTILAREEEPPFPQDVGMAALLG